MGELGDSLAVKINAALAEWLSEHGGGMVKSYAIVVDHYDEDGSPTWATAYADDQAPATTLGLLRWQTIAVEEECRRYLTDDRDDD